MAISLDLTIGEIGEHLRDGAFTAAELTERHIAAAESIAPLNAFTAITTDRARAMAAEADRRLKAGDRSPLLGVPVAVKDLFCTRDERSQACSKILANFRPPYESFVTEQLWAAGAVLIGKTNMDEFAMGSSTENSAEGPAINPWRRTNSLKKMSPGGSSGGSAVAVAAGAVPAALGTDTGGSIRQPAAMTGIVGIKPTYGRCSRWGMIAFASSLDQAGPLARCVADAALVQDVIAGHDPQDSTSANQPPPGCAGALTASIGGCRIGIPKECRTEGISGEIMHRWEQTEGWLRDAGASAEEISLPHARHALPAYYIIAPAEASSNLARYDGVRYGHRAETQPGEDIDTMYARTRAEGFGPEVRRRVLIGTYVLSHGYYDDYYLRAQKFRALVRQDFDKCFANGIDAILTPTTPTPAFAIGEKMDDPVSMYLNDIFTVAANLAGLPAVSVPAGLSTDGLPIGMQIIGRPWEEAKILTLAKRIEEARIAEATDEPSRPEQWWRSA